MIQPQYAIRDGDPLVRSRRMVGLIVLVVVVVVKVKVMVVVVEGGVIVTYLPA